MNSCLTFGFTLKCFSIVVKEFLAVLICLLFKIAAASFSVMHLAFIQTGVVIRNPKGSRKATVGWTWPITRVEHFKVFFAGHVCPWKRPTVFRVMPVEGWSCTVGGSSGSRFPSWFPRIIWMSSMLVSMVLKNSGMSRHSPDSAFAMVCFTSPRIMRAFGFVTFISLRSF